MMFYHDPTPNLTIISVLSIHQSWKLKTLLSQICHHLATCGAGDAHFSGTPDLTLLLGSTLPSVQYTEFARLWNTSIGND